MGGKHEQKVCCGWWQCVAPESTERMRRLQRGCVQSEVLWCAWGCCCLWFRASTGGLPVCPLGWRGTTIFRYFTSNGVYCFCKLHLKNIYFTMLFMWIELNKVTIYMSIPLIMLFFTFLLLCIYFLSFIFLIKQANVYYSCVYQRTVLDLFFIYICSCFTIPFIDFCFCLYYLFYFSWDFTLVFLTFWVNMTFSILTTNILDWSIDLGKIIIHMILCDMIKSYFWKVTSQQ